MAAATALSMLEIVFIFSLKFYYIEYIDPTNELTSLQVIIAVSVILQIYSFLFIFKDKWKHYFKEFDKLPRYKNIIGTWVVILIVAFILVTSCISINAMSEIASHRPK
jgi:amino acid transporter